MWKKKGYRLWGFFSPYDFLTLAFLFLYVHLFYNAAISMNIYVHVLSVTGFFFKEKKCKKVKGFCEILNVLIHFS